MGLLKYKCILVGSGSGVVRGKYGMLKIFVRCLKWKGVGIVFLYLIIFIGIIGVFFVIVRCIKFRLKCCNL